MKRPLILYPSTANFALSSLIPRGVNQTLAKGRAINTTLKVVRVAGSGLKGGLTGGIGGAVLGATVSGLTGHGISRGAKLGGKIGAGLGATVGTAGALMRKNPSALGRIRNTFR